MPIHHLYQNSEDAAYNAACNRAETNREIAKVLARRLVHGPKGGISPCPTERARGKCWKIYPKPPPERVCVECLIEHAEQQIRNRKKR